MISLEKARLSQIGVLRMGETIIEKDCTGEGLPIYSADKSNRPWAYSTHFKRINKKGAIVIGARGTIGFPRLPKEERFGATQTTITFTPTSDIFVSEFVHYVLQGVDFDRLGAQQAVPMLTVANLADVSIPEFPKPEQTEIVAIISTLDRAIEQTEALIAKQQRIKTGLMQDLLTKGIDAHGNIRSEATHAFKDSPLGRIPVEWDCAPLLHFVPSAEYGISTSLGDSGIPVLRMNNFMDGEADVTDLKYSDLAIPEHLLLKDGDVLFNRTNSWEHVGRTGIWRSQLEKATFASYLVRLNPNPDLLVTELLNIWLNWEPTQIAMRRQATPAVQQVNINPTNLRTIHSAFPGSIDEQNEIVKRLTGMRNAIGSTQGSLNKLRQMKTGLMHDLLTGERRVTPLLAEPAS